MSRRMLVAARIRPAVALGWLGTALVVAAVYVAVVAVGSLVTGEAGPSLTLSVLATVLVAATIGPVQRRCEELTRRVLRTEPTPPYETLRRFAAQVGAARDPAELPQQMARLLAEGIAAEWAEVWVLVNGRLSLMATHPADATTTDVPPAVPPPPSSPGGPRSVTVGHNGRTLGVLRVQERPGRPLTPVEERLFAGLAAQAGLALHASQLRAELLHRHEQLSRRAIELRVARDRLVAAQDQERRRLERDIHDGAQQQLVALGVNLRLAQRLAQRLADRSPQGAGALLREQAAAATASVETLRSLSRGVHPPVLRDEGLVQAFRDVARWSPVPLAVTADGDRRPSQEVEEALYFCGLEAVQNAVKHAQAGRVVVHLELGADSVRLTVSDDGTGLSAHHQAGSGLDNMRHRLASVAGAVHLDSSPGQGTRVRAVVPVGAGVPG